MPDGSLRLGPDTATLCVRTRRQGLAARAGHDLLLEVTRWEATLRLDEPAALELRADGGSLEVREAHGGAKPLGDGDRRQIRRAIEAAVLRGSPVVFRSTAVSRPAPGRLAVTGDLTLAGRTRPATFELSLAGDGAFAGRATVTQTRWGIRPYSALLGALRVADDVDVEVAGRLGAQAAADPGR